jgi:hypothetical protein
MPDMEKDFKTVQADIEAGKLFWKDGVVHETNGNKKSPKLFSSFTMNPWLRAIITDGNVEYRLTCPNGASYWEEICQPLLSCIYTPEVLSECSRRARLEIAEISFDLTQKIKRNERLKEENPSLVQVLGTGYARRQVKSRYESLLLDDSINSWRQTLYASLLAFLDMTDPVDLSDVLNMKLEVDMQSVPLDVSKTELEAYTIKGYNPKVTMGKVTTLHISPAANTRLGRQWKRLYPEN